MNRNAVSAALLAALLAGCATAPLPDGSNIQRLPESSAAPAPLSTEQAQALTELNARLLAEQDAARNREEALAAQRQRDTQLYWGLNYGYGGWGHGRGRGWIWTGSRWAWHPRWGVELWGPFAY